MVDKGWPGGMNGVPKAQQNEERATKSIQRKPKYMEYSLRGLRPNYSKRKAQEPSMDYPNTIYNDFLTHIIQEYLKLQVISNFLQDVEQIKTDLFTLGQVMGYLQIELREHRVNTVEGTFQQFSPIQRAKQKPFRFCNYVKKTKRLQTGRAKKCETKKYEECGMICPSKRMLLPYGTMKLATSTVDSNTIEMAPFS